MRSNSQKNSGEDDIRAFLNNSFLKDYTTEQRYQILSAAIQIAIPASGASFVKRQEITGLLKKFIEAGDSRSDIPSNLRNKDFGEGKEILINEWTLKEGETQDPEGAINNIVAKLRKKDIPDSERAKAIEVDRQKIKDALIEYLKDYTSPQKKEACLEAFYAYASHNDLLQQKIDTIQELNYLTLLLLEQLFIDKDNLSMLLRDIFKEIPQDVFPQINIEQTKPISNPTALVNSINGIWNSKNLPDQKRLLIQNKLKGISSSDIRDVLLPRISSTDLSSLILRGQCFS